MNIRTMYKFDPHGQPVDAAFRAIALDQLDETLSGLDAPSADGRSVIHEARRRCKKLRGLLSIAQPAFQQFREENGALRDAAAMLSHLRDGEVLHATIVKLSEWRSDPLLARLAADPPAPAPAAEAVLTAFRSAIAAIRARAVGWTLEDDADPGVLIDGARRMYRRARRRMAKAERERHPALIHDWRKASKNHGFHLELLKKAAPEAISAALEVTDRLATVLGDHHDCVVLRAAAPGFLPDLGERTRLDALVAERLRRLEHEAFGLGRQAYAETPRAFARRLSRYWATA